MSNENTGRPRKAELIMSFVGLWLASTVLYLGVGKGKDLGWIDTWSEGLGGALVLFLLAYFIGRVSGSKFRIGFWVAAIVALLGVTMVSLGV